MTKKKNVDHISEFFEGSISIYRMEYKIKRMANLIC